jgi:predicted ATP-binding protein involved in virulence
LYKGEEVLKLAVPVDDNGAPNTILLKKVNDALSHCARTKMSIPDMQQYWEMQDLPGAIDDNGNFIGNGEVKVEDFYVFSGITTLATVGDIEANELAREIRKGQEHENEIDRINQTLANANQNKKGDAKI